MRMIVLSALALTACTSADPASTADGGAAQAADSGSATGGTTARQQCRYDDECGDGQRCGDLGECVDGAACSQDFNCEAGERCETGVCRRARPLCAPCDAERQCGLDPVSGLPNPCVDQGDGRVCALESSARECPAGLVRNPGGFCLPEACGTPMGCLEDSDCPQGLLCAQRQGEPGLCVAYCRADTDCPDRGTCDVITLRLPRLAARVKARKARVRKVSSTVRKASSLRVKARAREKGLTLPRARANPPPR